MASVIGLVLHEMSVWLWAVGIGLTISLVLAAARSFAPAWGETSRASRGGR